MTSTSSSRDDNAVAILASSPRPARRDGVRDTRGTENRDTRPESNYRATDEAPSIVVIGSTVRAVVPLGPAGSAIVTQPMCTCPSEDA